MQNSYDFEYNSSLLNAKLIILNAKSMIIDTKFDILKHKPCLGVPNSDPAGGSSFARSELGYSFITRHSALFHIQIIIRFSAQNSSIVNKKHRL